MKRCLVCSTEKVMDQFSVKKTYHDGRNPYCKACESARVAAYVAARPEYAAKKSAYDKARNILKASDIRAKARIRYVRNSAERVKHATEWAKKNPEARSAIANAYKGRRRANCEGGMSGPDLRRWLGEQLLVCSYCGCGCESDHEVDHITPLCRGGAHAEDNITIACSTCNNRKSSKPLLIFLLDRNFARNTVTPEMLEAA